MKSTEAHCSAFQLFRKPSPETALDPEPVLAQSTCATRRRTEELAAKGLERAEG